MKLGSDWFFFWGCNRCRILANLTWRLRLGAEFSSSFLAHCDILLLFAQLIIGMGQQKPEELRKRYLDFLFGGVLAWDMKYCNRDFGLLILYNDRQVCMIGYGSYWMTVYLWFFFGISHHSTQHTTRMTRLNTTPV